MGVCGFSRLTTGRFDDLPLLEGTYSWDIEKDEERNVQDDAAGDAEFGEAADCAAEELCDQVVEPNSACPPIATEKKRLENWTRKLTGSNAVTILQAVHAADRKSTPPRRVHVSARVLGLDEARDGRDPG